MNARMDRENERLRKERDEFANSLCEVVQELEEAKQQVAALKAENERLKGECAELERTQTALGQARANRCDHCGANINLNGCLVCGAPQCCPQCCRIDALQHVRFRAENDRLRKELDKLVEHFRSCGDCSDCLAESDPETTAPIEKAET